jgi:hypothetical protein
LPACPPMPSSISPACGLDGDDIKLGTGDGLRVETAQVMSRRRGPRTWMLQTGPIPFDTLSLTRIPGRRRSRLPSVT